MLACFFLLKYALSHQISSLASQVRTIARARLARRTATTSSSRLNDSVVQAYVRNAYLSSQVARGLQRLAAHHDLLTHS